MKKLHPTPKIPGQEVDYWSKLSSEEKSWLNQFHDETINGYFSKDKKAIHKKKQQRKEISDSRNARRRDVFAKKSPVEFKDIHHSSYQPDLEDALDSISRTPLSKYFKKK